MRKIYLLTVVFTIAVLLTGCGGKFKDNTYKSLVAAHETYVVAQEATQSAYNNGLLDANTALEVNAYASIYAQSYDNAVESFQEWDKAGQPESGMRLVDIAIESAWNKWLVLKKLLEEKGILNDIQ